MLIMLCTCFTQDDTRFKKVHGVAVVLELLAGLCDDQNTDMQDLLHQQYGVSY